MPAKILALKWVTYFDKANGNKYYAVAVCNLLNGKEAIGEIDAISNIKGYLYKLCGDCWNRQRDCCYQCEVQLGYKLFCKFTEKAKYIDNEANFKEFLKNDLGFAIELLEG